MDFITYNTLQSMNYFPQQRPPIYQPQENPYQYSAMQKKLSEEIKKNIVKYFTNASDQLISLISDKILTNINSQLDTNIEEKVNEAFLSLGILTEEDINNITSS